MIADDVAVSGVLSVTVTVKITAPTAVGLPEINPVVGFNVKPVGYGAIVADHRPREVGKD